MIEFSIVPSIVNIAERVVAKQNGTLDDFEPEIKYFPRLQHRGTKTIQQLAESMKNRCTVTEADTVAVLNAYLDNMFKFLLDGKIVKFGKIGSFRIAIKKQTLTNAAALFDANNIHGNRVQFIPDRNFRSWMNSNAEFQLAPTTKAVDAAIAEIKKQ